MAEDVWPATLPVVPDGEIREYVLLLQDGMPNVLDSWHEGGAPMIRHVDRWTPDLGWVMFWNDYPEVIGWESSDRRTVTAEEADGYIAEQLGPTAGHLLKHMVVRRCGHYYDDERGPTASSFQ